MSICRKPYPSDVSSGIWSLIAPYLLLQREDAGQWAHDLREVFNGLRYIRETGAPWRWIPNDLPHWAAVYQQTQRWLAAGCFEALVDDLRAVLRLAAGRKAKPTAAIIDKRTLAGSFYLPSSGHLFILWIRIGTALLGTKPSVASLDERRVLSEAIVGHRSVNWTRTPKPGRSTTDCFWARSRWAIPCGTRQMQWVN
jgi:transposase